MIAEIGHFALVLALCVAVLQAAVPLVGAARGDAALMAWARPAALAQFLFIAHRVFRADARLRGQRFFARQCRGQFEQREAAALQVERRVEQPRGLDAPLGVHPGAVRRRGGGVRPQSAAGVARAACWPCRR